MFGTVGTMDNRSRIVRLLIILATTGLLLMFHLVEPENMSFTQCRFKSMTGLSCPTCGFTRSFHSAANFNFIDSILFNPFGFLTYFLVVLLLLKAGIEIVIKRTIVLDWLSTRLKILLSGIFGSWLVFWISRMILE